MIVVLTIEQGALAGACRGLRIGAWRIVLAARPSASASIDARQQQEIWNVHWSRIDRRRVSAIYGTPNLFRPTILALNLRKR
jgi:hypothetical protein